MALSGMKTGNASGFDGIPVEVWKDLEDEGIGMVCDMMHCVRAGENANGVEI